MESSSDEQVRNFINYRYEAKIRALSAKIVRNESFVAGSTDDASKDPNKVHVDLVYNMLLNPQQRLTMVVIKKTNTEKIRGSTD